MDLWDEEVGADFHWRWHSSRCRNEHLPFGELSPLMDEIRRVATEVLSRDKCLVTPGGEHSSTPPLVAAAAARFKGLSVLQIDAHADLRDCYMGTPHNHACAMRRSLDYARLTQVGIRSMSTEEAEAAPGLNTTIFYDATMRSDPHGSIASSTRLPDRLHHHRREVWTRRSCRQTGTPEPGVLLV